MTEQKGDKCKEYTEGHTKWYKDLHFYIFKFNRERWGETKHTLDSSSMSNSNIADMIIKSVREGTFISLEKVSMIEYGKNYGGHAPSCMTPKCERGNTGWPKCVKID